jgi:PKD repeat protein
MAQIMKYWNYPPHGFGFTSYSDPNYGTQSANFGATTYNWANMPNNISADNADIETLMYQCGVAVNMHYSTIESGAWVITADNPICAQSAYITYFGYDPSAINGVLRSAYQESDWITLLENEINGLRPVQYVGSGSGGGHTWVLDGYDNNNFFHMNWGWGSLDDGYFSIDALNPANVGTGGGAGDFNSNEEALIGIQKPLPSNADLQLYSPISVTPNPAQFRQIYAVSADIINSGTSAYTGDFCAALFNPSGIFIKYISDYTYSVNSLQPNTYVSLTFSDSSLAALVSGNYLIGLYYLPNGTNGWTLAGTTSYSYINPISVNFEGPIDWDSLTLYTPGISATPTTFTQGHAASVNFNVWNQRSSPFDGILTANIFNLRGDTSYQVLGTYADTGSYAMLPNSDYASPYLTVATSSVNVPPGTYLLGIGFQRTGSNYSYYLGGNYEPNPVYINVVAAPLLPDIYEPDNTLATAHLFPVNFSGNSALVSTTGSNCHIGTDLDYYEINLLPGYDYTVSSWLRDANWPVNNTTYSLDAAASYSIDSGSTWSDVYNGGSIPNFVIHGGGKVYFWVAPYFVGQTGTYLLSLTISRVAITCSLTASISPSGNYSICEGSSLNLTATSGSGYVYQWQKNGANIASNGTSQTYSATQGGTYSVIISSNGCTSGSSNTLILSLSPPPTAELSAPSTAGFTPLTVNFSDNSLNTPTQWEWSFPGGTPITSNSQNPSVTYNFSGLFDVSLKATNNCGSDSITKINYVNVLSTGIQDNSFLKSMSVFPNPTDGKFSLIAELDNVQKMKVSVFNSVGQMVYSNETDGKSASINMTCDLSNYARGLYFLKLSTGSGLNCIKILIQ